MTYSKAAGNGKPSSGGPDVSLELAKGTTESGKELETDNAAASTDTAAEAGKELETDNVAASTDTAA